MHNLVAVGALAFVVAPGVSQASESLYTGNGGTIWTV